MLPEVGIAARVDERRTPAYEDKHIVEKKVRLRARKENTKDKKLEQKRSSSVIRDVAHDDVLAAPEERVTRLVNNLSTDLAEKEKAALPAGRSDQFLT